MRNYVPKWPSGAPLHTLSKLYDYDVPVGFVTPPPYFEAVYCFICGRRRVDVARYWMICLVLLYILSDFKTPKLILVEVIICISGIFLYLVIDIAVFQATCSTMYMHLSSKFRTSLGTSILLYRQINILLHVVALGVYTALNLASNCFDIYDVIHSNI